MSSNSSDKKSVRSLAIKILLLIVFIAIGFIGKSSLFSSQKDFPGPGKGSVTVTIETGNSLAQVANCLKDSGVVASVDYFLLLAQQNAQSQNIQPGSYKLHQEMPSQVVLDDLIAGNNRSENGIVIPEGKKATWIIKEVSNRTKIPLSQFQYEIDHPQNLGLPKYANGNVEGFLFPATYQFVDGTSAHDILRQMVSEFLTQSKAIKLEGKARALGMTPMEVLTAASLVQAESHPRDFSKVAKVIDNRLSSAMKLQLDSTVNYGLGKSQVILTSRQLAIDTKYNTYIHEGLPPTPINNPGIQAIKAVLNPASGPWLFFITVNLDSQLTRFTDSYARFLEYKQDFLNYCARNVGKC